MPLDEFRDVAERPLEWFRSRSWEYRPWAALPGLRDKHHRGTSYAPYQGGAFDTERYELVQAAIQHEHCLACHDVISEGPQAAGFWADGYTHGGEWLCPGCYRRWIQPLEGSAS